MRSHVPFSISKLAVATALACAVGTMLAAAADEPPPPATSAAPPAVPFYLQGVDLSLPAQEAFRSWPPQALLERPYWLPWSVASFQRARLFDRPVLLIMTVAWSRQADRLDRETLADPEVLRAINDGYVLLRVDGDRRPDLRERYRSGGWPEVALLLPDGRRMLSQANPTGKALPIRSGFLDAKGMLFLLREGKTYYERWPELLRSVGRRWEDLDVEVSPVAAAPDAAASDQLGRWLVGNADHAGGGFGAAPKLVIPGLVEYAALRDARAAGSLGEHARLTLEKLVASPLRDRREGGFHRVATAADWGGIQYEKMLATNAAFLREAVFVLRQEDAAEVRAALQETARFVRTTLRRGAGALVTGQCADPLSEDGGGYWLNAASDASKKPPNSPIALAGENAMAGAALLRAGALLGEPELDSAGRAALDFVLAHGYASGRGVNHVLEPVPESRRFLTSQADAAFGFLDAYETTGDARYLRAGKDVADFALNNLLASGEKMLRDRLEEGVSIGALKSPRHPPSDNARLARALLRLSAHGLGEEYRTRAASILGGFAGDLASFELKGVEIGLALEELIAPPLVIRIEGAGTDAAALRRAALALPRSWLVVTASPGSTASAPAALATWGGKTVRVERAELLAGEVERLLSSAAGPGKKR